MKFANLLAAAAAVGLVAAPVMAQAAAQPIPARSGAELGASENLRGGFVIPLIALIAIILGILAATNDNDDDLPDSP
ncbi:MAG TPA: hypothetical protein VEB68_01600 [Croceibacterium sp.]|nr:hypothetical protein [Croceibacterium sp.]